MFHKSEVGDELLVAVETYRDAEALKSHMASPHMQPIVQALPELLGGPLETYRLTPRPMGDAELGVIAGDPPASQRPSTLAVVAIMTAKEGALDDALAVLEANTIETHKEPGVNRFAVHTDAAFPRRIVVVESYDDPEVLAAHYRTPHLGRVRVELPPLLEGGIRNLRLTPLRIGDSAKGRL